MGGKEGDKAGISGVGDGDEGGGAASEWWFASGTPPQGTFDDGLLDIKVTL